MIEVMDNKRPRLLWFDDSDRTLTTKIKRAIEYYEEKYRIKATDVVVNPLQAKSERVRKQVAGLPVHRHQIVGADYVSVGFVDFKGFKSGINRVR